MAANKKISEKHINWLNFGIFYGACLFICGFTFDEVLKSFKKKKTPDDWINVFESTRDIYDNDNWGYASSRVFEGKIYFVLYLKNCFDFKDESQSKLAHELIHIASFHIVDFLDPMKENEAFAYLHTHLMKQCHDILRK